MTSVPALRVRQWLESWDGLEFDAKANRRRPDPHFFLAAMPASTLRALAGIQRRTARRGAARQQELGIQRRHDVERSERIREYVYNGFPWSELSAQRRESGDYDDLRKPGWLPTAIVVNILTPKDKRRGASVAARDLVTVKTSGTQHELVLPQGLASGKSKPTALAPIEVIDGQHRLWAFDPSTDDEEFELPVVAFQGLDISWQAYLFYSINITPKKINRSLAYDLYPLLRSEDWLDRFEGTPVYRETRSQELTEALWGHPRSPWHSRINMLGERGRNEVTQAAWIRSLMATFVRTYSGRGVRGIGGLFGAPAGEHQLVLSWSSSQQAAFLIRLWQLLEAAIGSRSDAWMRVLRRDSAGNGHAAVNGPDGDPAFRGPLTLLNTDQGVRGFQHVVNDLCYQRADRLRLADWASAADSPGIAEEAIDAELKSLGGTRIEKFLSDLAAGAARFDWRTSRAPGLTERERREKARFRGSGGYKELRRELTEHLIEVGPSSIERPAREVADLLFSE